MALHASRRSAVDCRRRELNATVRPSATRRRADSQIPTTHVDSAIGEDRLMLASYSRPPWPRRERRPCKGCGEAS